MQFKDILNTKKFIFTFELVPARSSRTLEYRKILKFLEESTKHCLFDTFSITENPGGHPSLAPFALGSEIKKLGFDPVIHFSCKDKNRNEIESELLALDGVKLRNLLVITGDYPLQGFAGKAKPVFDLDSVQLLYLITLMEKKQNIPFLKGCVVNPFKIQTNEVWLQYFKLYKKFKAGAHFVITQSGFSPQKYKELLILINKGITRTFAELFSSPELFSPEEDEKFKKIPLIGSIIFPSTAIVKLLLKTEIPGIFIGKRVLKKLESAISPIEREKKALEISAKLTAILKGLGYKGVHLCVFPLNYDKILIFMEYFFKYESLWENLLEEFDEKIVFYKNSRLLETELSFALDPEAHSPISPFYKQTPFFLFSELFHFLFFSENTPWFKVLVRFAKFVQKHSYLRRFFTSLEYFFKTRLYKCQECGDCSLYELNYNCPQSGCAKYLLNGPCGGSINGYCEVFPFEKKCLYIKAVENSFFKKNIKKLLRHGKSWLIPPRNWELNKTSSWLNFYLKKDHSGRSFR